MMSILEKLAVIEGDITQQRVDAIVNAANESLMAGGGVSGAIHRAAGLGLQEECIKLKWCDEGEAKITKGYNLPAKWVIHTVGPVWEGGDFQEDAVLSQCYSSCFEYVDKYNIKTIAFPAISTGSYGFPVDRATRIAVEAAKLFLKKSNTIEKILFVCFDKETYDSYILNLEKD
jgi:O-acetyl-ADP-ribose deacetylase